MVMGRFGKSACAAAVSGNATVNAKPKSVRNIGPLPFS